MKANQSLLALCNVSRIDDYYQIWEFTDDTVFYSEHKGRMFETALSSYSIYLPIWNNYFLNAEENVCSFVA